MSVISKQIKNIVLKGLAKNSSIQLLGVTTQAVSKLRRGAARLMPNDCTDIAGAWCKY